MAISVEDVVNEALLAVGWRRLIGDIYEGSPASRAALEVYGRTRDELLAQGDWPFARREVALGTNGQTPPSPWTSEYAYPSDCLRVRTVRPGPLTGGSRENDPRPVLYSVWNDHRANPSARAILCAESDAVLVYTGKVTNPAVWEPGFLMALIAELAKKLTPKLAPAADRMRLMAVYAAAAKAGGEAVDDLHGPALPTMAMPAPAETPRAQPAA